LNRDTILYDGFQPTKEKWQINVYFILHHAVQCKNMHIAYQLHISDNNDNANAIDSRNHLNIIWNVTTYSKL